ncbi:MAG: GNAT family N-acetyltransferase [Clostridia bacterium]|nr:GNAT family N-acetyltransferase [Clostridia bacterium]
MVRIELLEEDDFSTIVKWNKGKNADFLYQWAGPGYDYPITEEMIRKRIENGANREGADTYIYKIIDDSKQVMLGTIELFRIDRVNKSASIGRFLVDERYRGRGLGQIILKKFINIGFEEFNLQELMLRVFDFNNAATICYEKVGFRKTTFKENAWQASNGSWGVYEMKIAK